MGLTGETPGSEGRRAHTDATRGERALVPGHGVLVCGHVHHLQDQLDAGTVDFLRMIESSATDPVRPSNVTFYFVGYFLPLGCAICGVHWLYVREKGHL